MTHDESSETLSQKPAKKRKVLRTVNPHRHVLPMDEVPIDLGIELERRIDTRTNALLLGLDGGVGPGIESGSDLNSIQPGEDDETEYESITDNNLLTQTSYINGIFQETSVLHEDEVAAAQHCHQRRTTSNKLETDSIEKIPAKPREGEPLLFPPEKKGR
ncbi:MAG: hypothetical protein ACO3A4_12170 [Silvanigrellaceae bacterium]